MKLRWYVAFNKVLANDVKAYSEASQIPMMEARRILVDERPPVLQIEIEGEWHNVPTVSGPHATFPDADPWL